MAKPRQPNVGSLVRSGEHLGMQVRRGFRWVCDCGVAGPWTTLPGTQHGAGRPAPDRPPPGLLLSLTRDWERHVEEDHPDADLTLDEWAGEDEP